MNSDTNIVNVNKKFKLRYPNQKQSLESQFEQLPILVKTWFQGPQHLWRVNHRAQRRNAGMSEIRPTRIGRYKFA